MKQGPFSGSEVNISAAAAAHLNFILKIIELYSTQDITIETPNWVEYMR